MIQGENVTLSTKDGVQPTFDSTKKDQHLDSFNMALHANKDVTAFMVIDEQLLDNTIGERDSWSYAVTSFIKIFYREQNEFAAFNVSSTPSVKQ